MSKELPVLVEQLDEDVVASDVQTLFEAVAAEQEGTPSFEDLYDLVVTSGEEKDKVSRFWMEPRKLYDRNSN